MLLATVSCGDSSVNLPVEKVKEITGEPSDTVTAFFKSSEETEVTDSLVRSYPDRFVECLFMTPEDCLSRRQKKQISNQKSEENSKTGRVISIGTPEVSLLVKDYQQKIQSNRIALKQIKSEWTTNDESRVRVELDIEGKKVIKDLLLFKETKWQIIEIANENQYPNYAQPSGSNRPL